MPESALAACLVEHVCTAAVTKTTNLLGGSCGIFTLSPFLPFSKPSVLLCDLSVPSVLLCAPLCSLLRRAHSLSLSLHLLHPRAQLPVPSKLSALGLHCSSVLLVINLPSIGLCTALHCSALCTLPSSSPSSPVIFLFFPGSCTGCSRPHVAYAISIVSAPCRVSESFCVSAPNIHSTSLRV